MYNEAVYRAPSYISRGSTAADSLVRGRESRETLCRNIFPFLPKKTCVHTKSGSGRILCLVLKKSVVALLFSQQLESKNVSLKLGGVDLFVSIHIFFILAPSIHISGVNHKRTCLCWLIW